MRKSIKAQLHESYPRLANDILTPVLNALTVARAECGGELDNFLVALVVGLRTVRHPGFRDSTVERLACGDAALLPGFGTNIRSIAESLAIPKETARRRVNYLIQRGWLAVEGRRIYLTAQGFRELQPIREQLLDLVARSHELVLALGAGEPPARHER